MRRIVVGCSATDAGADAVVLAARLALATGATLDLAIVLPGGDERSVITPPNAGYDTYLRERAEEWLAGAVALVPAGLESRGHIRYAESVGEGLMALADEVDAAMLVVGAAHGGLGGRHRLGSVASDVLHYAAVPVVLAPEDSRLIDPLSGITRVTAALGTRAGAGALLEASVALATATGASLRLVSLVTVDLPASVDTGVIRIAGAAHAAEVLEQARAALPEGVRADAIVAEGDDIEDAVRNLSWQPGEIALVGSSRLAQPRRLFLGSTAAKILHELPVPLAVVPRPAEEGERP
jgi:nucleotide-binding universal stress UspA family protein